LAISLDRFVRLRNGDRKLRDFAADTSPVIESQPLKKLRPSPSIERCAAPAIPVASKRVGSYSTPWTGADHANVDRCSPERPHDADAKCFFQHHYAARSRPQLDQIADFTQVQGKIDLSAIDANPNLAGDQAFTFISDPAHYTGDWTGVARETTDAKTHAHRRPLIARRAAVALPSGNRSTSP
jgi:hypothetical protein